ncbi:MAG: tetratricopeptide repeat protein [Ignavibacteriaceae bacterium]|nr:tetratricopeptide repeat protein [Ignavibacteriaceae bacterium]
MELADKYRIKTKLKSAGSFDKQGKFLHAFQIYNTLIHEYPDSEDVMIQYALHLEGIEKYQEAERILLDFISRNPDSVAVRLFCGQLMLRYDNWEGCVDVLSVITLAEEPVAAFFTGYAQYKLQEYGLADIGFRNFLDHIKEHELIPDAYFYLAKVHLNLDDPAKAIGYLDLCAEYYSSNYEVHLLYAILHHRNKMYAHALSSIDKALKLNAGDDLVIEWAAEIYYLNGNYSKSRTYYKKMFDFKENLNPEIFARLGDSCFQTKKYREAADYFTQALALDPENKLAAERMSLLEKYIKPVKK